MVSVGCMHTAYEGYDTDPVVNYGQHTHRIKSVQSARTWWWCRDCQNKPYLCTAGGRLTKNPCLATAYTQRNNAPGEKENQRTTSLATHKLSNTHIHINKKKRGRVAGGQMFEFSLEFSAPHTHTHGSRSSRKKSKSKPGEPRKPRKAQNPVWRGL